MTARRGFRSWTSGASAVSVALVLAATLAALATLWTRHAGERSMDRVAVVVDGLELAEWARATGQTQEALLQRVKQAGVVGVGVHELTLQDAALRGELFVVSKATLEAMDSPLLQHIPPETPAGALIAGWTEKIDPWIVQVLAEELPHVAIPLDGGHDAGHDHASSLWLLTHPNPANIVLGLHPGDIEAVQSAGLVVVPRLQGGAYESSDRLARRLEGIGDKGFGPVLFKGTQVVGYPTSLYQVAEALAAPRLPIGLIEFAEQRGFGELAKALGYDVIRVHSITEREMAAGIPPRHAIDRWLRAVRERQIRLLYVRLYLADHDPSALTEINLSYIEQLTRALHSAGYQLGVEVPSPARPTAPPVSLWTLGLIALASGACAGWIAWLLFIRLSETSVPSADRVIWGAVAGTALFALGAGGALWLKGYTILARQSLALLTALCFPVASVCLAARTASGGTWSVGKAMGPAGWDGAGPGDGAEAREGGDDWRHISSAAASAEFEVGVDRGPDSRRGEPPVVQAVKGFAVAVASTLIGAAFVGALLSDVRFLLKIEEFRGVKLAHLAPLAALALMLAVPEEALPGEAAGGSWRAFLLRIRVWMSQTIRMWELGAALGVVAILWVYLMRTGNQGLPVPAIEEAFRGFLEENFQARPRTKEFLIGHPALVVALAYWRTHSRSPVRRRRFAVHLLLLLGAVGQISILNTFAHAHSAVAISVARTVYGVLLGLIIGVVAVGAIEWLDGAFAKGRSARGPGKRPHRYSGAARSG